MLRWTQNYAEQVQIARIGHLVADTMMESMFVMVTLKNGQEFVGYMKAGNIGNNLGTHAAPAYYGGLNLLQETGDVCVFDYLDIESVARCDHQVFFRRFTDEGLIEVADAQDPQTNL